MASTSGIPEGQHTVTPHLMVRGAAKAIEFYKKAFGAQEQIRMTGPDGGSIMHAQLKIGDSVIYLGDADPNMGCQSPESLGGTAVSLHLYVENVDAAFQSAINAGATVLMPVSDMFWGDRYGKVRDPFGHEWGLATHKEDLTHDEIRKRAAAFFESLAKTRS